MADTPAPEPSHNGNAFAYLTRKLGPLPVWAWALIAVGAYYWYTHYGPGASSATANSGGTITEKVTTTHSAGANVTVPGVVGESVEQATVTLRADGLKASGPKGQMGVVHKVTSTSPAAGSVVPKGSTVLLTAKPEKEGTKSAPGKAAANAKLPSTETGHSGIIGPPGSKGPKPKPKHPGPPPPSSPPPVVTPPPGRWQTMDTITEPADLATADASGQDTESDSVLDVIPHRPLGM